MRAARARIMMHSVCMCVYVCVCVFMCVYVWAYVGCVVRKFVYFWVNARQQICVKLTAYEHACVLMCACMCMCVYVCMCVYEWR